MTTSKPNGLILGLLAETYVHPGAGQSEGAIDLPVAREKTTDYPFVPGSGVKGAMKDAAKQRGLSGVKEAYGETDNAGDLLFSDAKLLLLPVRSLTGAYKWLTCPYLIERWERDRARADITGAAAPNQGDLTEKLKPAKEEDTPKVLLAKGQNKLFLEERVFDIVADGDLIGQVEKLVAPLLGDEKDPIAKQVLGRLRDQLAVVQDEDFAFFASYALPVHARNVLDDNKVSKNLWYEETIAPDTLLYTLVFERRSKALEHIGALLNGRPYLQLGGNETIGQGWFRVTRVPAATGDAS